MKELIKPEIVESEYISTIEALSENRCSGGVTGATCNKVCDSRSGSTNNSIKDNEIDIIF